MASDMTRPRQKQFQLEGTKWLLKTPRALLADDPGLGKTNQALLAAVGKTLIVTPAMLKGTWTDEKRGEIQKWRPRLDYTWVSYSSLCERNGRQVYPYPKEEYDQRWDTIIFDEAHYLKGRKTKWTQAALILSKRSTRVFMLTGSPIPNWAQELFVLLKIIHPNDRKWSSYWRWIETYFNVWKPPWGGTQILGLHPDLSWADFYAGNDLDTLMLRRLREEVLTELPPLTEQYIEVEMKPAQNKVYLQLKKEYIAHIEATGTEVSAWSDAAKAVKLSKITTGLSTEDPKVKGDKSSNNKSEALRDLLSDYGDAPVVIFCHFRNTVAEITDVCEKLCRSHGVIMGGVDQVTRDKLITRFQDGEISTIIGTLETLGEGVTLTRSSICIFVEHSWRPSRNDQAMRRLHRIGQEKPVTVIHIISKDSLDQHMMSVLTNKTDQQIKALTGGDLARMM